MIIATHVVGKEYAYDSRKDAFHSKLIIRDKIW